MISGGAKSGVREVEPGESGRHRTIFVTLPPSASDSSLGDVGVLTCCEKRTSFAVTIFLLLSG